jgi:phospholipid/cholesterol/gamma-HCH transport system ATP-binding protein
MAEMNDERDSQPANPAKRDKRDVVEARDGDGSLSDSGGTNSDGETLTAEVSADVAPTVGEFMEQAAQQNEAAAEAVPDVKNKPGPYIAFEHVYKSFGDFVVLEDVSFYVLPGETLCILGRSGVGKSVSLQILMGFLKPDKGMVKVAGEDICFFSERELQAVRQKVTMVFQNGERCLSYAGARGDGGGSDFAGGEGIAGDGGGGGDGEPAAVRPVNGDEAIGRDCAGTGFSAGGSAV